MREDEGEAKPRILIVEDNAVTGRILARMLRDDYMPDVAPGYEDAMAMAEEVRYDLFVLDIDLGERRTGVEVLHALREWLPYHRTPFVACTAYALPGLRERFLEVGFDGFISKPFTKQHLLDALGQARNGSPHTAAGEISGERSRLRLPPLPQSVPEIMKLMQGEAAVPDIERLREILSADPILSSWVLRRINTAFYSLQYRISDIDRAATYLGFTPVCNLVLSEMLSQTFAGLNTAGAQRVYRHLLKLSLATAAFARHLAYRFEFEHPEMAFTGGIFTQVGRMALLGHDPEDYAPLWYPEQADPEGAVPQAPSLGLELIRYQHDHVALGVQIAEQWNLPDDLVAVLRHAYKPLLLRPESLYHQVLAVAVGMEAAEALLSGERLSTSGRAVNALADAYRVTPERLRLFVASQNKDVGRFLDTLDV